jgi:hypothetical protein
MQKRSETCEKALVSLVSRRILMTAQDYYALTARWQEISKMGEERKRVGDARECAEAIINRGARIEGIEHPRLTAESKLNKKSLNFSVFQSMKLY